MFAWRFVRLFVDVEVLFEALQVAILTEANFMLELQNNRLLTIEKQRISC